MRPCSSFLLQLSPQHLPGRVAWQLIYKPHASSQSLVVRHLACDQVLDLLCQLGLVYRCNWVPGYNKRLGDLCCLHIIPDGGDARVCDHGMPPDHFLQFGWAKLEPGDLVSFCKSYRCWAGIPFVFDHILQPVNNNQIPLIIQVSNIPSLVPSRGKHALASSLFVALVAAR